MSDAIHLSVEQAEALLASQDNLMLLDMRSARDYSQGHDPRAIHLSDLNLGILLKHTPKQMHLLICCYLGHSSQDMVRLFRDFGFANSYSLDGGYAAWSQKRRQPRARLTTRQAVMQQRAAL